VIAEVTIEIGFSGTSYNQTCQFFAVGERFFPKLLATKNRPSKAFVQKLSIWEIIYHRLFLLTLHREIFRCLMPAYSNHLRMVS